MVTKEPVDAAEIAAGEEVRGMLMVLQELIPFYDA